MLVEPCFRRVGPGETRESSCEIDVAPLRLSLRFETEDLEDFQALGIARIQEVSSDGQVRLDRSYVPPCVDVGAASVLADLGGT